MTRYEPKDGGIVYSGGGERYYSNRYIYEGNTSAFIMAGDRPHIRLGSCRCLLGTLRMFACGRPLDEIEGVRMTYTPNVVKWDIEIGGRAFTLTVTTPGDGIGFVVKAEPETEIEFSYAGFAVKKPDGGRSASQVWNLSVAAADISLLTTEFDQAWTENNVSGRENGICYIENPEIVKAPGGSGRVYILPDGDCEESAGVIKGNFRRYLCAMRTPKAVDPAALFEAGTARGRRISETLLVDTPDECINSACQAAAAEIDAAWHPPKSMHGNMSWNQPFVGWMAHGHYIIGKHDRSKETLKAYYAAQVKDDIKRGFGRTESGTLPDSDSRFYGQGYIAEDQAFYNMQTQFFHQMIAAWRYSGDEELGTILRDALRLHLSREDECFDAEGTGLYESVINTWPTDSVYTPGGAVEETCYVYAAYRALAELTEGDEREEYIRKAEKIKKAFFDRLWIKERGYPGAFAERYGYGRLHPDAWIYSAFMPIECGVIEGLDAVQTIDYPRWALKRDENGLYWISNWTPGIWSVRECSPGENMQLAIAGFRAGQPDESVRVVSGLARRALDGTIPGDLTNPTIEAAMQTARAVVEGIFGYRPDYPHGKVVFEPSVPASWDKASVKTGDFELSYTRNGLSVRLIRPAEVTIRMRLYADRLIKAEGVKAYRLIPSVGGMIVEADMGYTDSAELRLETEGFRDFDAPEILHALPDDMSGIIDPQDSASTPYGHHMMFRKMPGGWYRKILLDLGSNPEEAKLVEKQRTPLPTDAVFEKIDISSSMNADVREIFRQRYMTPRPEKGCHAEIGYDGYALWTFPFWGIKPHELKIDRFGEHISGCGAPIDIMEGGRNVVFTSLWDNYPSKANIKVDRRGRMAFVAVAGSTNPNLCGIENARLTFRYTDGTSEILPLVNPKNYIQLTPYPDRAPTHGYEERRDVFNSYDEDLLTDFTPDVLNLSDSLRALVIRWPLDGAKKLDEITLEAVSPDIVAGAMAVTIAV